MSVHKQYTVCHYLSQIKTSGSQHFAVICTCCCADHCWECQRLRKIHSTKACDAGAQVKSSATERSRFHVVDFCCQNTSTLDGRRLAGRCWISTRYCSSCSWVDARLEVICVTCTIFDARNLNRVRTGGTYARMLVQKNKFSQKFLIF